MGEIVVLIGRITNWDGSRDGFIPLLVKNFLLEDAGCQKLTLLPFDSFGITAANSVNTPILTDRAVSSCTVTD